MRRVRTALFLVLYRVIPSCHSWGFSPIAPSWGCPKGLKTKIWPECNFLRLRIVAGRKGANCGPESQQISCGAAPFRFADEGKESAIAKKAARKPRFLFSQRGVVWSCNKKVDYLGGVQDISFHVKQDAASESGFWSGWHADRKFRAPGLSLFADFNRGISFCGGGVIKQR